MNLAQALACLPAERLREIGAFYGLADAGSSGPRSQCRSRPPASSTGESGTASEDVLSLASRIAAHLLVPANLIVAVRGLDEEELTAAKLICLSRNGAGVVMEQCHQKLNYISRKWRRNGARVVEGLLRRGLVFTEKQGYRQVYYVPDDLRSVLSQWFLDGIYSRCIQPDPPGRRSPDHDACLRHIFLFLSYVRKNPCKLTQNGMLFKKTQQELEAIVGPGDAADEVMFPVRYAPRLAFVLFFAKSRALVEEREGNLVLGRRAEEWRTQETKVLRTDVFRYWMDTFMARDIDLTTLFWIIMRSPNGSWLSLESLVAEMESLALSHVSGALSIRAEKNLVNDLEYMGAVEVSRSLGAVSIRVTPLGRAMAGLGPWPDENFEERIYVEPSFEILVPSRVHPHILWEIDFAADLVKADQMMVYRLTRTSVYRAVRNGLDASKFLRFLERHSGSPVPQNVTYSVTQWAGQYGRVELVDALFIKCDTPHLTDEIMVSRKLAPYVVERLGPTCIRADRSARDEISRILVEEGYMPRLAGDVSSFADEIVGEVGSERPDDGNKEPSTARPPIYEGDEAERTDDAQDSSGTGRQRRITKEKTQPVAGEGADPGTDQRNHVHNEA